MSITDKRLTEIQARTETATEGPWYSDGPLNPGPDDSLVIYTKQGGTIAYVQPSWDDAEFIEHAREDIPALLAEIDRLRGKLADAWDEGCEAGVLHEDSIYWNAVGYSVTNPYREGTQS